MKRDASKQGGRPRRKEFGKIIWAADPLEDKRIRSHSIRVLRDLAKRTGAAIEPVYMLSDGLLDLSIPKSQLVKQFQPVSERALKALAKECKIPRLVKPTVLVSAPSSKRASVEALDRYAQDNDAALIFVNSHGRRGIERAVLGSFAETLTLCCKTPVLISGPRIQRLSKLDHILFPTNFSPESLRTFKKVLELAQKLDARITVFNAVLNPIEPFIQSGVVLLGGGFLTTQGYVDQVYDRQKEEASQLVAEARKQGVMADAAFDIDSTSISLSILQYAKKHRPGLIAMASEHGAVSVALLGSVGRSVAREASCPVWFLRC